MNTKANKFLKTRLTLFGLLFNALFIFPALAEKGWIATSVEVVEITNTGSNGKNFTVKVSGGDNNYPCENGQITFPLANAGNTGNDIHIHNRAFSMALTALTTGSKVSIFSYEDNSVCNRAAHIKIVKP
ncbi:DUF5992 family protein [Microbulbifer hydrolyticus]|uniref:Uncharacterized protein n=1 Tax=Microbulbifer hydrolyticus TaxID=48074 RepID=A0A6P1TEK7_9GAMM|nr:DUF5992 family protein [Microbulbifer hydrolyticus]MBB5212006.1 hypothetical protein [Microbulbifer hydrolyticus]QHQ39689.1 hypothetical protein GTQ55_12290 [Microbulbifer hydrolyticus]